MANSHTTNGVDQVDRRRVLQAIAASSAVGIMGSSPVGATKEKQQLVGASYDSTTHMFQSRSTMSIKRHKEGVSGRLNVAGFPSIEFGEDDDPLKPNREGFTPEYWVILQEDKYRDDDNELFIKFLDAGNSVVGDVTYRHARYSNISFTVAPVKRGHSEDSVKMALENKGEGVKPKGYDYVPKVPKKGIPTNTSLVNIMNEVSTQ